MISECNKQAQRECKASYEWAGKVIHRELCKKLKYVHTTAWYLHKSESVLLNEMHNILLDFEIQTDHLILARRPDLVIII